jgi:hypothetical protein
MALIIVAPTTAWIASYMLTKSVQEVPEKARVTSEKLEADV